MVRVFFAFKEYLNNSDYKMTISLQLLYLVDIKKKIEVQDIRLADGSVITVDRMEDLEKGVYINKDDEYKILKNNDKDYVWIENQLVGVEGIYKGPSDFILGRCRFNIRIKKNASYDFEQYYGEENSVKILYVTYDAQDVKKQIANVFSENDMIITFSDFDDAFKSMRNDYKTIYEYVLQIAIITFICVVFLQVSVKSKNIIKNSKKYGIIYANGFTKNDLRAILIVQSIIEYFIVMFIVLGNLAIGTAVPIYIINRMSPVKLIKNGG